LSGSPTKGDPAIWGAAQEYYARGWSLIPIESHTKRTIVSWKPYQTKRAGEAKLRRWFEPGANGIGVVLGNVSDRLISRDFDTMAAYDAWASLHPDWAARLPTVATDRGRHVYARVAVGHIDNVRFILGKPEATGAILAQDGELRCGTGCFNVLPPSIHPSGHQYSWIVPLTDDPLPEVDVFTLDFLGPTPQGGAATASPTSFGGSKAQQKGNVAKRKGQATEEAEKRSFSSYANPSKNSPRSVSGGVGMAAGTRHREHRDNGGVQSLQKSTEAIEGTGDENNTEQPSGSIEIPEDDAPAWSARIEQAIRDSLPKGPGQRHRQVFELARALKAIPELADAPAIELRPYVRHWYELAAEVIRTKPFDETWIDFLKAWPKVKFPLGHDPMGAVLARAKAAAPPAVSSKFDHPLVVLLISICRDLQRVAGEGPFFLSCRTAGRLLVVDPTTANRWLFLLIAENILEVVEKGEITRRRATRYRYLPKV
jgi:hypothetical protein